MSESSAVQKTVSKKVWHFIEHPLTLTVVAIMLALIGKQPTFFIAWVILTIAFVRTGFFEGQSLTKRLIGNAFASAMLAVILFVAWKVWFAEPDRPVVIEYIQGLLVSFNELFIKVPWRWVVSVFLFSSAITAFVAFLIVRRTRIGARSSDSIQWQATGLVTKPCPERWLHDLPDGEVNKVWEFIELLKVGVWRLNLEADIPTIKWGFVVKNNSLFPISLDGDIRGHLLFEGIKLLEQRTLLTNDIDNLGHLHEGTVMFEQRLSKLEAEMIKKNTQGKFNFQGLQIYIKGGSGFDQIQSRQLLVPDNFKVGLHEISDKTSRAIAEAIGPIEADRDALKGQIEKATAPPGNLVINAARYGVPGIYEENVTGILAKMVEANTLTLKEYYNDFLPDKVQGKRKQLHIDYFHNGIAFSVTVPENARITLPIAYQDPKRLLRPS